MATPQTRSSCSEEAALLQSGGKVRGKKLSCIFHLSCISLEHTNIYSARSKGSFMRNKLIASEHRVPWWSWARRLSHPLEQDSQNWLKQIKYECAASGVWACNSFAFLLYTTVGVHCCCFYSQVCSRRSKRQEENDPRVTSGGKPFIWPETQRLSSSLTKKQIRGKCVQSLC